ncbi:MAG TPA: hypothetical protein VGQ33_09690, partial [Vicinamibacteria bacterium]|nr:hypothetical protein [Vicinamibacteria bacterium]
SLDARGHLVDFQAVPPEQESAPASPPEPSWDAFFAAALLDRSSLRPASPEWVSLAASDARAAWTGTWPGTDRALRVEAAAFHGRPVYFSALGPWSRPQRTPPPEESRQRAAEVVNVTIISVVLALAIFLGRRNYVRGRGDGRGALRLGTFVFAVELLLWVCRAHPLGGMSLFGILVLEIANALFLASVFWLLYMALEPYVRRRWPEALISWSRLLAGRFRDPLVGRDVVWGVILGALWAGVIDVKILVLQHTGASPLLGSFDYLDGGRALLAAWLGVILDSIQTTLVFFFTLFLLRVLLRRPWLAAVAFVVLFATPHVLGARHLAVEAPTAIAIYAIAVLAGLRFGLLTLAVGIWTVDLMLSIPFTASLGSWYAGPTLFAVATILGATVWGFRTALAGRPLWSAELFDEGRLSYFGPDVEDGATDIPATCVAVQAVTSVRGGQVCRKAPLSVVPTKVPMNCVGGQEVSEVNVNWMYPASDVPENETTVAEDGAPAPPPLRRVHVRAPSVIVPEMYSPI